LGDETHAPDDACQKQQHIGLYARHHCLVSNFSGCVTTERETGRFSAFPGLHAIGNIMGRRQDNFRFCDIRAFGMHLACI
jgi:hypothetical protein